MKITKAFARDVIDIWKDQSPLYRGAMNMDQLETYLKIAETYDGKPLLTQADVLVIVMALKLAGAKLD